MSPTQQLIGQSNSLIAICFNLVPAPFVLKASRQIYLTLQHMMVEIWLAQSSIYTETVQLGEKLWNEENQCFRMILINRKNIHISWWFELCLDQQRRLCWPWRSTTGILLQRAPICLSFSFRAGFILKTWHLFKSIFPYYQYVWCSSQCNTHSNHDCSSPVFHSWC